MNSITERIIINFSYMFLQVSFISIAITIIFFTLGVYLEKLVLKRQIQYLLNKYLVYLRLNSDKQVVDSITDFKPQEDSKETKNKIDKHNKKILITAISANIGLLVSAIILVFIIARIYKKNNMLPFILGSLKTSLLVTLIVAISYILFTLYIAYNYIYIDDTKLIMNIIQKVRDVSAQSRF